MGKSNASNKRRSNEFADRKEDLLSFNGSMLLNNIFDATY